MIRALALTAVAAALLSGCGGDDDGPTAEQQAGRAAAQKLFATREAEVVCRDLVDDTFIEEYFDGERDACSESPIVEAFGDREVVQGVSTGKHMVDVSTVLRGGINDGTAGEFTFRDEDGRWRLHLVDNRLMLIMLVDDASSRAGMGYGTKPVRDCVAKQLVAMDGTQALTFLQGLLAGAPNAQKRAAALVDGCR